MPTIDWLRLREAAGEAMTRAYAPYSHYAVGAAGLVDDGRVVVGCNVENASYGLGLCAECGMISSLCVSGGGKLLAVVCVDRESRTIPPCGRCRQLLWEHGGPDCLIDTPSGPISMADLLPLAFDREAFGSVTRSGDEVLAVPASLATWVGRGTVFVHPDVLNGSQVWTAYWERSSGTHGEPAGILEEAPVWVDIDMALRWGRARALRVIVVDAVGDAAWAGIGDRPEGIDKDWLS